jgi:hypothetical protein
MAGVLAALALLVGAAGHHVDSGVRGVVTIGPTCPGPVRLPPDPRCDDRPYSTRLKVVRARSHALVKKFDSRSDGRFVAHLSPGRYLIEKAKPSSLPSFAPVAVKVKEHAFARVTLRFDSGIR